MMRLEKGARNELPAIEVFAVPVAPLVGREQVIVTFKQGDNWVGRSAVLARYRKVRNGRVAVI
jgi:hypothetical protein